MVPFGDLFNHSDTPTVHWLWQDTGFAMYALRDIEEGEEIVDSYGTLSNSNLLAAYGFILPEN